MKIIRNEWTKETIAYLFEVVAEDLQTYDQSQRDLPEVKICR